MTSEKSVWKTIEEDREDYQYFKKYDNKQLKKKLEEAKHNGYLLTI